MQNDTTHRCINNRMKKLYLILINSLLITILSLINFGCGVQETNVERGNREQILYIGNGSEPEGLDPHIVTGVTEHNIISALFEGLVSEDPIDLHPVPGVAEYWEVFEKGKRYVFHIREDAFWSNGDAVTAHDFVYSYKRILSPALAAKYAYMLYVMKNARAFNVGEFTDFSNVGAKALDDKRLEIVLETQIPYFLELQNHYSWWPVHKSTIEKFGEMTERGTSWTKPENIVSNGPFNLKNWRINQSISVKKNLNYWDAENVTLNGINFLPIDSRDSEERAFRVGYIHITQSIPLHRIDYYRNERPDLSRFDTYLGTYCYLFNIKLPPLNDIRVRKALSLSLNREEITQYITRAGQQPAYHFTPPDTRGYNTKARIEYDIEKAKVLLAEAGYPGGQGFPVLELLYNTSESHHTLAEAIQQMWKKTLNIEIKLLNQEWKVFLNSMHSKNYQIGRFGWIGDYNDPNTFLDMWVTDGGNNRTGWSNSEYDKLISLASKTLVKEERFNHFQDAEAILLEELPVMPIYFYVRSLLIQPSVRGWYPNILDHHPYKSVSLEAM